MSCSACKSTLEAGSRFCSDCGTPVSELPQSPASPAQTCKCGNPIQPDEKFCSSCGKATSAITPQSKNFPQPTGTSTQQDDDDGGWVKRKAAAKVNQHQQGNTLGASPQKLSMPADDARPLNKPYKALVLGQTGSGKSTLLNMICNYFRGGTLQNLKILIPTKFYLKPTEKDSVSSEADVKNISVAQTQVCNAYNFTHPQTGKIFQFIDSPGLADTRGAKQDDVNINNILKFCEGLSYLDCIIIVVNGAQARFDVSMRTVCQRFAGNLPTKVLESVVVAFTMCTTTTKIFDETLIETNLLGGANLKLKPENIFYFQNTTFSFDPKKWTDKVIKTELEPYWETSMEMINNLCIHIAKSNPIATDEFALMRDTRDMLKGQMAEVLAQINKLDQVRQKIDIAKSIQARLQDEAGKYQEILNTEKVRYDETVDTPYHNTNCALHKNTCHEQCGLDEIQTKGDSGFLSCACFNGNDFCNSCALIDSKAQCGHINHYHAPKKWVRRDAKAEAALNEIRDKFDECITNGRSSASQSQASPAQTCKCGSPIHPDENSYISC